MSHKKPGRYPFAKVSTRFSFASNLAYLFGGVVGFEEDEDDERVDLLFVARLLLPVEPPVDRSVVLLIESLEPVVVEPLLMVPVPVEYEPFVPEPVVDPVEVEPVVPVRGCVWYVPEPVVEVPEPVVVPEL